MRRSATDSLRGLTDGVAGQIEASDPVTRRNARIAVTESWLTPDATSGDPYRGATDQIIDAVHGALRSTPRPVGPTSSTSFAKTGSSATAPPNSTAKRSSEIAPSRTGVRRTSRTPASTLSSDGASGSFSGQSPQKLEPPWLMSALSCDATAPVREF